MKAISISFLMLLLAPSAFADAYHDLALDAASKFSQIGKNVYQDLRKKMVITRAESREVGAHIEASYEVKSPSAKYEIEIVDGLVTKVTLTAIQGS